MFSKWSCKLAIPTFNASTFGSFKFSNGTPPCSFRARIVATITTPSGFLPAVGQQMSKNFSAPKSAPNPASVTTTSPSLRANLRAIMELQP